MKGTRERVAAANKLTIKRDSRGRERERMGREEGVEVPAIGAIIASSRWYLLE